MNEDKPVDALAHTRRDHAAPRGSIYTEYGGIPNLQWGSLIPSYVGTWTLRAFHFRCLQAQGFQPLDGLLDGESRVHLLTKGAEAWARSCKLSPSSRFEPEAKSQGRGPRLGARGSAPKARSSKLGARSSCARSGKLFPSPIFQNFEPLISSPIPQNFGPTLGARGSARTRSRVPFFSCSYGTTCLKQV